MDLTIEQDHINKKNNVTINLDNSDLKIEKIKYEKKINQSLRIKFNYAINNDEALSINNLEVKGKNALINGNIKKRLEGNLNVTFPKYSAEKIMMKLTEIACSTGSACTSSVPQPSHVLLAIGLNKKQINNTIRFGIGRLNNIQEINYTIKLFERIENENNQ